MRNLTILLALTIATVISFCATSPGQTFPEGWPIVEMGTSGSFVAQASSTYVDVLPFFVTTGTNANDICAAINSAINSLTTLVPVAITSMTIDARGIAPGPKQSLGCFTDPFKNQMNITGRLLLPGQTINTSVQWTMPNQDFWIEGLAMSNMSMSPPIATVLKATSAFACTAEAIPVAVTSPSIAGCPVIFIGFAVPQSFGVGIRNLSVDCVFAPGVCIGAASFEAQEGAGIDTVNFLNQKLACIVFDAAEGQKLGGLGVSNAFLRNVDCNFITTATSSSIGIYMNTQDGPAEISNTTVAVPNSGSTSPVIGTCLEFNGGRGTNVNYFHCEHANTALTIGDSNVVHDVTIRGLTASASNLGVNIKNTGDFDISVESVDMEGLPSSGFIGVLQDAVNSGVTVSGLNSAATAANLAQYTMTVQNGTVLNTDPNSAFFLKTTVTNQLTITGQTLSQLVNTVEPPAGTIVYCLDCKPNSGTNQCGSGGSGALAVREGPFTTGWYCK